MEPMVAQLKASYVAKQEQLTGELQSNPHPLVAKEILRAKVATDLAVDTAHEVMQDWLSFTGALSSDARSRLQEAHVRLKGYDEAALISAVSDPAIREELLTIQRKLKAHRR